MSYIRAPRLHQSTALLCPLLIRISGALKERQVTSLTNKFMTISRQEAREDKQSKTAYMYSMVPQNVWVTVPS